MALLTLSNIHVRYGSVEVLHGIDLHVDEGEIVTILGANGAGKSTTLLSINRLVRPCEAQLISDGKPLLKYPSHEVVNLGIAQSPEGRRVFGTMSVLDVDAKANSSLTLVQVLRGDAENGAAANLVRIRAAEGAHVRLVQIQMLGSRARRWDAVAVEEGTGAKVEQVRVELGGSLSACGTRAMLGTPKSEYDLDAVYFGGGSALLDYNDVSVHTAKDTLCEMHTAGVLTGNADKILRGTIDFRRGAKRSVGHESEDVLLFSPTARNRTAPLILCGEEEVEGQHAASIGRLDEEKLYYLRSRGLSEAQARRLMVDARFAPAIEKIPLEALREEVRAEAARRLDETC